MEARAIISKYSGKCRTCKKPYAPGDRILWVKGRTGQDHLECGKSNQTVSQSKQSEKQAETAKADAAKAEKVKAVPAKEVAVHSHEISWSDLKRLWIEAGEGKTVMELPHNQRFIREHTQGINSLWHGGSFSDVKRWITHGYQVDGLAGLGDNFKPTESRRRLQYAEEGELQLDLAYSGFDYPFLEWEKRERIPGLSISATVMYSAGVSIEEVREYELFIAQTCYALESQGVDLKVAIRYDSKNLLGDYKPFEVRVVVKEENEAVDFASWSALFSPAGMRALGFSAGAICCDRISKPVSGSYGNGLPENSRYRVDWNPETREIHFVPNYFGQKRFPREEMQRQLEDVLKQAK